MYVLNNEKWLQCNREKVTLSLYYRKCQKPEESWGGEGVRKSDSRTSFLCLSDDRTLLTFKVTKSLKPCYCVTDLCFRVLSIILGNCGPKSFENTNNITKTRESWNPFHHKALLIYPFLTFIRNHTSIKKNQRCRSLTLLFAYHFSTRQTLEMTIEGLRQEVANWRETHSDAAEQLAASKKEASVVNTGELADLKNLEMFEDPLAENPTKDNRSYELF